MSAGLPELQSELARFMRMIEFDTNGGCWLWATATFGPTKFDPTGYGSFAYKGRNQRAHRFSYMLFRGAIPEGMLVRHVCDMPPCVNPDHLLIGTTLDNERDKRARGREYRPVGEESHYSKLTEEQVRAIFDDNRSCPQIAADYGMSHNAVWMIKTGRTWKHVTRPRAGGDAAVTYHHKPKLAPSRGDMLRWDNATLIKVAELAQSVLSARGQALAERDALEKGK